MELARLCKASWCDQLGTLHGLIVKAETHPKRTTLLETRLVEDMFPLATQIRFLCNMPGEALTKLAGIAFTSREDDPQDFAEARKRILATRALVDGTEDEAFVSEDAPIVLAINNGMTFDLTAGEYVRDWALPQFYFHQVAAYAILRRAGLAIGKADYVPHMMRYLRSPTKS